MRALLALSFAALVACVPPESASSRALRQRPDLQGEPASAHHERPKARENAPVATTSAEPPKAADDGCPARPERLAHAKETISAWHERIKVIAPIAKFVEDHKCVVKDTSGSVLVTRTKEAGGTRVAVKHGHENEIVCNVPEARFPDGLDVDVMNEIRWLDETDESTKLVDFGPNCRDAVLEVSYGNFKKQKAILAMP